MATVNSAGRTVSVDHTLRKDKLPGRPEKQEQQQIRSRLWRQVPKDEHIFGGHQPQSYSYHCAQWASSCKTLGLLSGSNSLLSQAGGYLTLPCYIPKNYRNSSIYLRSTLSIYSALQLLTYMPTLNTKKCVPAIKCSIQLLKIEIFKTNY